MSQKLPKSQIDQLSDLEAKLGLSLSAVAATFTTDEDDGAISMEVIGEVVAPDGLRGDIEVVGIAYDDEGDAIGHSTSALYQDKFAGFDAFCIYFGSLPSVPSRLRVYPKEY